MILRASMRHLTMNLTVNGLTVPYSISGFDRVAASRRTKAHTQLARRDSTMPPPPLIGATSAEGDVS